MITNMLIAGAAIAVPLLMLHVAQSEMEHADKIVAARKHTTE